MTLDVKAIYDLVESIGQEIYLCELTTADGNIAYGIPKSSQIQKQRIQGYLSPKTSFQIALSAGANQKKDYTAYIPATEFARIKANNFLAFGDKLYQIEEYESVVDGGKIILYKLNLTIKHQNFLAPTKPGNASFNF